jgi:NTE family protein
MSTPETDGALHPYVAAHYAPQADRTGTALCLSGGGYRAALFHLGSLTRLNELGVLSQIDTFSSVSGGSILAAHLATRVAQWPDGGSPVPDWDDAVVEPFLRFTRRNIRNKPIAKRYLLPWNWVRDQVAVETLEAAYASHLTPLHLSELPAAPRFVMSATDMAFGVNWVFDSGLRRVGDYRAGYAATPDWPLARAVAASSCFPPIFDPLPIDLDPAALSGGDYRAPDRDDLVGQIALSDGGVYDNMGLEPVWKDHRTVLVSDGGAVFEAEPDAGFIWRLNRYTSIAGRQGSAVRKRWLIANFVSGALEGTYWSVGSTPDHYHGAPGYPEGLIQERIQPIRTDLDRFSHAEQQVLMNHGYLLADAAVQTHAAELIAIDVPAVPPYPGEPMQPEWVAAKLEKSHKHGLI